MERSPPRPSSLASYAIVRLETGALAGFAWAGSGAGAASAAGLAAHAAAAAGVDYPVIGVFAAADLDTPTRTDNRCGASTMDYGMTITLDLPYEKAVPAVKAALQEQGFGVLTEIDAQATLKEKLGHDMEPYIILGACNPDLAHRALEVDREIGLLLPCNVVVRAQERGTLVQALDPQVMVRVPERDELRPIAEEADVRIQAALDSLKP